MTSAIPSSASNPPLSVTTPLAASPPHFSSGAVPAQHPTARSYANATKTATTISPAAAGASANNAKSSDAPVNGSHAMAHGGHRAAPNGNIDHSRKASVVIDPSGTTYNNTPNGGPVVQSNRPSISFGSMNAQGSPLPHASTPFQQQTLPAPVGDARVISPTSSPSPIPQPAASGGRPPSSLQSQGNGLTFGSTGPEHDHTRPGQMSLPMGQGMGPMHERRTSSQSMHSDMGSNMNRNFTPSGRGRGYTQQQFAMQSPAQGHRQLANQPRPGSNVQQQYQPPSSPYGRGRGSPAPQMPPQPHMGGNQQMQQYGGYPPPHMQPQHYAHHFDPNSGYYQSYGYQYSQYPGQPPPQSPRHSGAYPNPYNGTQGHMQPPYNPTDMSRSASQGSQRPPSVSSLGGSQTPAPPHQPPQAQTSSAAQGPTAQSSNFVRPVRTSVRMTDADGNEINLKKKPSPSPSAQAQSSAPVIVSTPSAPTPPPRAPSAQHARSESRPPVQSQEERKAAFQEQMQRQLEEQRKASAAPTVDAKAETKDEDQAKADKVNAEKAAADAKAKASEEAAATAAKEAEAVKAKEIEDAKAKEIEAAKAKEAETVKSQEAKTKPEEAAPETSTKDEASAQAAEKGSDESTTGQSAQTTEETEDERIEREIAEMEAAEKAEEERERTFQEKRKKEKDAAAKVQAEKDANVDQELKRQEREAEAREEERERERERESGKSTEAQANEPDQEAKAMFAELKKPEIGPGAVASESGADEDTTAQDAAASSKDMPPPATRAASKSKPAYLKLETNKRVEAPEPTPGMQALRSARFLEIKEELKYPEGIASPNPALNNAGGRKGRAYDKDFLLQFQNVFKEKPSVDWDQKVRETLGPGDDSARAGSSRTPSGMGPRQGSVRAGNPPVMGGFALDQARTLPMNTTSEQRFAASSEPRTGSSHRGLSGFPRGSNVAMPGAGMTGNAGRGGGFPPVQMLGPNSSRQQSQGMRGGRGGSKRGPSRQQEAEMANKMPLTAHMEIKSLEKSTTGWKATSLGAAPTSTPDLSGHMSPELVQRKVKAALNKMTPEKFDKISDQILDIASQSKTESDGRTLRQVIQLTFEKACDEAHWAGMYAQFCHKMLTAMSADIRDETITDKSGAAVTGGALFRKYLLNRCQEEFERGWQANLPDKPEDDAQEAALLSDEYYVAAAAKRRGLGLIQFIGQLYKLRMLTIRIMHECVMRLLNFEGEPDESAIENLTTLLKSVGGTMDDEEQGRSLMNTYFLRIEDVILKSNTLASRPRFMILDLVDLRKAHWKGKGDGSKGPKTIEEIHNEAAAAAARAEQERQRTSHRGGAHGGRMPQGRGDARQFSGAMAPPVDHTRTTVGMDDLRRLQNRGASQRQTGGGLGPGGSLGPGSSLSARSGSRRGIGPPSSGNTTRTNTPPVDSKEKKEEPAAQQNAFSALAQLDSSGGGDELPDAASPPSADRSKSPAAVETAEENA